MQHKDASSLGRQELSFLEEEQIQVLARIDDLKNRLMELEQQLQESKQEVQSEILKKNDQWLVKTLNCCFVQAKLV